MQCDKCNNQGNIMKQAYSMPEAILSNPMHACVCIFYACFFHSVCMCVIVCMCAALISDMRHNWEHTVL